MATVYLDPDGDDKNGWDENPAGPAWSCINDAARQPTAPAVPGQYLSSSSGGANSRSTLTTATLATNEYAVGLTAWVYCVTQQYHTLDVNVAPGYTLGTVPQSHAEGWASAHVDTTPVGQAALDGLKLEVVLRESQAQAAASVVYAAYLEVTTAPFPLGAAAGASVGPGTSGATLAVATPVAATPELEVAASYAGGACAVGTPGVLIESGEAFGVPVMGLVVAPAGTPSGGASGQPAVASVVTVRPAGMAPGGGTGAPVVSATNTVTPPSAAAGGAMGAPSVRLVVSTPGVPPDGGVGVPSVVMVISAASAGAGGAVGQLALRYAQAVTCPPLAAGGAMGATRVVGNPPGHVTPGRAGWIDQGAPGTATPAPAGHANAAPAGHAERVAVGHPG